jgi:hypothetical protein
VRSGGSRFGYVIFGFFTVNQNERVVKTSFGKAQRLHTTTLDNPMAEHLRPDERERYQYPQVRGDSRRAALLQVALGEGPQGRRSPPRRRTWPSTRSPPTPTGRHDARGRHQGPAQHRPDRPDPLPRLEQNLYAYLFGVKRPLVHVLGYFISILRERIANFEAPPLARPPPPADGRGRPIDWCEGISINDLRKNLRDSTSTWTASACPRPPATASCSTPRSSPASTRPPRSRARWPPSTRPTTRSASEVSLAQAAADQKIVQSRRAVEIETLNAQAEVEPLLQLATSWSELKQHGGPARWAPTCAT